MYMYMYIHWYGCCLKKHNGTIGFAPEKYNELQLFHYPFHFRRLLVSAIVHYNGSKYLTKSSEKRTRDKKRKYRDKIGITRHIIMHQVLYMYMSSFSLSNCTIYMNIGIV